MPARPAPRHRTARAARSDRPGDVGAATLEHTGTAVLVAAIVVALVAGPAGPRLAEALRLVVCQITGGDCGPVTGPVPECVLASHDESLSHVLTVVAASGGGEQGSYVEHLGDGRARLVTRVEAEAGVEVSPGARQRNGRPAPGKEGSPPEVGSGEAGTHDGGGPRGGEPGGPGEGGAPGDEEADGSSLSDLGEAEASAGLTGTGTVYAVRTFDSDADLADYRADHTGTAQTAVDVVSNLGGQGAGDLLDSGLRRAGLEQEDTRPPEAYRQGVATRLDAEATASLVSSAEARAGLAGGSSGTFERRADGSGYSLTTAVSGSALAGLGLVEAGGAGRGTATGQATVTFDEHMDITDLTLATDTEDVRLRGTEEGKEALTADASRSTGTATTRTWSTHVDDADRAAFRGALPQVIGAAPAGGGESLGDLGERLRRDAVRTRADWEVAGTEESHGPALSALVKGFELSHTTTTQDRTLKGMTMMDPRQGGTTWTPVTSCG